MFNSRRMLAAGVAVVALGLVGSGYAQERFPSRPIQIIVGANPGGGIDSITRVLTELAEPTLGQKFVIENKPGGGGTIGMALAAQAKPDGYTLTATWSSPVTATVHSVKVPYTADDFTPILRLTYGPYVFCVSPDFPANNAKEFIDQLKAKPGQYTYGNDGVGGTGQLAAERIFKAAGIKQRTIPFSGAVEVAKNFLGGYVPIYIGSILPIKPHVEAGKAKCPLLTSAGRNPILPEAQGLEDVGMAKSATVLWRGILGPKGIPADRAAILEKALRQAAESPRFKEFIAKQGETLWLGGPDELRALIREEYKALGEVSASLGLKKN
jgi:tripartite-type tricarboxylate transporter receptor subunit TctC